MTTLPRFNLIALLALFTCSATHPAWGEAISIETDFGAADLPVQYEPGRAKGKISGVVPAGWGDDSVWADVDVAYAVRESEGQKYLRLDISRVASGVVQMQHPLPPLEKPAVCELVITMRNQSRAPATIGVRLRGKPYTFLWDSPALANGEWETRTFRFKLEPSEAPIGLYLRTPGVGHVDIASVRLSVVDPAAYKAKLQETYPDGGADNLLRDTRFAGPLPAGWSIDRDSSDGDEVVVTADAHGMLEIETHKDMTLHSVPFRVLNPLIEHRAIAKVSGEGEWWLEVVNQGRVIATSQIDLPNLDATEAVVGFRPDLYTTDCQLRFRSKAKGKLLIDWVKVGPKDRVEQYDPTQHPAVGIGLRAGDASAAGVQFSDEAGAILVSTVAAPVDARLNILIKHGAQGGSKHIQARAAAEYALDYLNDPSRPLGAYRVQAWLSLGGKKLTPVAERVVYRLRRPRYWGRDAPASAFGVHTNSTTRHNTMAKAIGINWVRLHDAGLPYVGWHFIEPEKGKWAFRDEPLKRYRDADLLIFGQLGTAPAWASYYPPDKRNRFGYFDKFFQPRDLADYANYVKVVTTRYKQDIRHWDVWNEPWIHAWWAVDYDPDRGGRAGYLTSEHPQADFVKLKKTAYETSKSVNADIQIAGFNTTTSSNASATRFTGDAWSRGVYDAGGMAYSDILVYHQYAGGSLGHPGDDVERGLETAFGYVMRETGGTDKPIWMTEGQPNIGRTAEGLYKHSLTETAADPFLDSGDRMVRYLTSLRANGVSRIFLYSMHAHNGVYGNDSNRWRVITQTDGTLHPTGAAISTLAYHIDGRAFVRHVEPVEGIHAYVFADESGTAAVVIPRPGHAEWVLPGDAEDLWGNPIKPGTKIGPHVVFLLGDAARRLLPAAQ